MQEQYSNNNTTSKQLLKNNHQLQETTNNRSLSAYFGSDTASVSSSTTTTTTHRSASSRSSTDYSHTNLLPLSVTRQARLETRRLDQIRFKQTFQDVKSKMAHKNLSSSTSNTNNASSTCSCNQKNQKQFNCIVCTQNFPVLVRRATNGESESIDWNVRLFNKLVNLSSDDVAINGCDGDASCNNAENDSSSVREKNGNGNMNNGQKKKSISPTVLSILALSQPSNTFNAPPNVSLSNFFKMDD